MYAPVSAVRDASTEALKKRPPQDYVPMLLGALSMPIESSFRVATDTDGDFVVAWQSYGQDGSATGIFAQRFAGPVQPAAPSVSASSFLFETAPHRLRFTFDQDVAAISAICACKITAPPAPAK